MFVLFLLFLAPFALAQQNFFNVPNSELTTKGHSFFQEQINSSSDTLSLNSTYDYGLTEDWEAGVNVFGANIDRARNVLLHNYQSNGTPLGPSILLNTQKGFVFNKNVHAGIGAQAGSGLEFNRNDRMPFYLYANLEVKAQNSEILFVLGVYHANKAYRGNGNGWLQVGLELPIIEEKLHFVGDYINGDSFMSVGSVGLCYFPLQYYALSLGHQFPSSHAPVGHSVIIELTFLPHGDLNQGKHN